MEVSQEALDTQADSTEAPVVEQSSKTEMTKPDVADPARADKETDPLKQPVVGQPAFDAEKSFAEMQKKYAEIEKHNAELRKWATQTAQERAEYRRKLEALEKAQKPIVERFTKDSEAQSLQQLQRALQTQDPKAIHEYMARQSELIRQELQEKYMSQIHEQGNELKALQYERAVEKRKGDSKNYPNFADLEPTMIELVESGKVKVEISEENTVDGWIDHLYNLAKTQHSEEAIKQAETHGRQKAEAELANEARAAVAGGGKGSVTAVNPGKMTEKQLRQYFIDKGMVEE